LRIFNQITVFVFLLVNLQVSKVQGQAWRCVRKTRGVIVYAKKSEHTGIKIIKIETTIHTTLSAIVAVIKDAPNNKNWIYLNKSAKLLESDNPFFWVYYGQSDAPWPVADRDIVVQCHLKQDSVNKIIHINSYAIPEYIPIKEGYVRIPYSLSQWTIVPEDNGTVHVEFMVEINLGGKIPKWMMNLMASRGPYESIIRFRKQLTLKKYRNIHLSYIMD